jgi:hypothetical protein
MLEGSQNAIAARRNYSTFPSFVLFVGRGVLLSVISEAGILDLCTIIEASKP